MFQSRGPCYFVASSWPAPDVPVRGTGLTPPDDPVRRCSSLCPGCSTPGRHIMGPCRLWPAVVVGVLPIFFRVPFVAPLPQLQSAPLRSALCSLFPSSPLVRCVLTFLYPALSLAPSVPSLPFFWLPFLPFAVALLGHALKHLVSTHAFCFVLVRRDVQKIPFTCPEVGQ